MKLMEVRDAAFTYDNKRMIFDGINFDVQKGEILCIIGPNGCGKSTLIDCLLGLKKLKRGHITIGGRDMEQLKPREFAEHVAYVPQGHKTTFAYTVLDVVTMGRTYAAKMFSPPGEEEKAIAREALKQVGLEGFEDREYTKLSGGELQRVKLADKLEERGQIFILDEPTDGLHLDDIRRLMKLFNKITDQGNTLFIIEHSLDVMKDADYIVELGPEGGQAGGEILFTGTPKEMLESSGSVTREYLSD